MTEETMESAPDSTEQNVMVTSDQLRSIAEHILKRESLLDLPMPEFDMLLVYYGDSAAGTIADEIHDRIHDFSDGEYARSRYSYPESAIDDLEKLRRFPGGPTEAIQLLPLISATTLDDDTNSDNIELFVHHSELIDNFAVCLLHDILRGSDGARLGKELDDVFRRMKEECEIREVHCMHILQEKEDANELWTHSEDPFPVYKKSLQLMREWHSRQVGPMLAMKVAGHVLPAELVELIGECFYDPEALTLLDEI